MTPIILVFGSFFLIAYTYFLYPTLLYLLARNKKHPLKTSEELKVPTVSIIITARNEEAAIGSKIQNTLNLWFHRRTLGEALAENNPGAELIVASDASTDLTDSIVRSYATKNVKLSTLSTRGGKEQAQKQAFESSFGDIIIFTDAKVELDYRALEEFLRYLQDPTVGAVSSVDKIKSNKGEKSGEGAYVRYEMLLRKIESDFDSLVGLSGSCFAVRRCVCHSFPTNIPSDFALLLEAKKQGLRGLHGENVVASYSTVQTESQEFERKTRTVLRGINALCSRLEVLNPFRFGVFSWMIASHKLCRWLVPFFFILGTGSSIMFAFTSIPVFLMACASIVFIGTAFLAFKYPALQAMILFRLPLFFIISNTAVFLAWIKFLTGEKAVLWDPSAKERI